MSKSLHFNLHSAATHGTNSNESISSFTLQAPYKPSHAFS